MRCAGEEHPTQREQRVHSPETQEFAACQRTARRQSCLSLSQAGGRWKASGRGTAEAIGVCVTGLLGPSAEA